MIRTSISTDQSVKIYICITIRRRFIILYASTMVEVCSLNRLNIAAVAGTIMNMIRRFKGGRWDDYASTADDTQSVTSKGTTDMMTQAQVVRTQIERMERPVPPPLPVTPPQPPSPRGGSMYSNRYCCLLFVTTSLQLLLCF